MRIAFLLPRGSPRSLLDDPLLFSLVLAESLRAAGHEVDLLGPEGRGGPWGRLGERVGKGGLPFLGGLLERGARVRGGLRKRLREGAYDLVEVVWGGGAELFLPCLEGIPFTGRFLSAPWDGGREGEAGTLEKRLADFLGRTAGREFLGFSAGSVHLVGRIRDRFRWSCLSWVVHPAVDPAGFRAGEKDSPPPESGPVLCLLGGKEEARGRFLAEVIGPLLEEGRDLSFLVLAEEESSPAARSLEAALSGAGFPGEALRLVRAPGAEALPGLLRDARAFLVPSFGEGGTYALLGAMAAGVPLLVPESPWIYEYVRPEIDGLVLPPGNAGAFREGLAGLLEDGKRARSLAEKAGERVESRFDPGKNCDAALAFWSHLVSLRRRGKPSGPAVPLGPGNWFRAWWLAGEARRVPLLERDSRGVPLLARLSLEELGFVKRVLSRAWWESGGSWDTEEADFLKETGRLLEEKVREARSLKGGERPRETGLLALPPLDHPLFGGAAGPVFLQESWSIRPSRSFRSWIETQAERPWFLEEGIQSLLARRIAVLAAVEHPSNTLYRVLWEAYRNSPLRAALLGEDRSFFAGGEEGRVFREAVERLGLHLPLERPPVFRRRKRAGRFPPSGGKALPGVTVLVPSYKHETFITATLESVLGQSYPEVSVVVVDDHSPDGTADAARSLGDPRVVVVENERNLGLGKSLLSVLPRVETPYLALLNSDDLFHPERIAACVEALENRPGAAVAATELVFADGKGRSLRRDNTPLVEVGPRIRDLVHWYEEEIRGADPPLDRTSLDELLRHNHLLTSSNIFCRTEYMKEKASLFEDLLYTVDWCVFLESAAEGKLLFLDRPLLAYRLHENNTMWFREESRPGYVMEIHRLLSRFFRRLAGRGKDRETARLLLESAGSHGEVEGWFLFLAGLGLLPRPEETPSWLKGRVRRISSEKLLFREAGRCGLDGRRIGRVVWEAQMFLPAEMEVQACREEKAGLAGRLGWAEGSREEFRRWAEDEEAQRVRLAGENAGLREKLREGAERERGLRAEIESLRGREKELLGEVEALRAEGRFLEETRRRLEGELREVRARKEELERSLAEERKARAEERDARAVEREAWAAEREAFLEEARKARAWAKELRFRYFRERARVEEAHQWQVGTFLLDRMKLLGVYKTLLRAGRNASAGLARFSGRLRGGGRIVLAPPGPYPSPRGIPCLLEADALGPVTLVLSWGKGEGPYPGKRIRLAGDGLLQKRDRRFFHQRKPGLAQRVETLPLGEEEKGRLFTFARTAGAWGAGYVQAAGLDFGAWEAFAAGILLEIPFGVSLTSWDLLLLEREPGKWGPILEASSLLAVETAWEKERLLRLLGEGSSPEVLLRGPLPLPLPGPSRQAGGPGPFRVAAFGTVVHERELTLLPEALAELLERGVDAEFRFLGGPREDPEGLEAWDWFQGRVYNLGLTERFFFEGDFSLERAGALLAGADMVVEGRLLGGAPEGLTFLAGALGAGIPAAAAGEGPLEEVPPGGGLFLYGRGDPSSLAEILAEGAARPGRGISPALPGAGEGPFFRPDVTEWRKRVADLARSGRRG